MRKSTHERIEKLEKLVVDLRSDLNKTAQAKNRIEDMMSRVQNMSVPIIVDGEKIPQQSVGQHPQYRRQTHTEIKMSTAILMLAKMTGVELVYVKGTEGTPQAVSVNEYSEPDEV